MTEETDPRDVALLFATRIIRLFCYGFLSVVLALYLAEAGLREQQIGLLQQRPDPEARRNRAEHILHIRHREAARRGDRHAHRGFRQTVGGREAVLAQPVPGKALLERDVATLRTHLGVPMRGLADRPRKLHEDAWKAHLARKRAADLRVDIRLNRRVADVLVIFGTLVVLICRRVTAHYSADVGGAREVITGGLRC